MPYPYTFPVLYDEKRQVRLDKINKWGYINPGYSFSFTYIWSRNGKREADINVFVNMVQEGSEYIVLDYKCNGEPVNFKLKLVSVPSNLGFGKVWYFFCPYVKKRCRVLYSVDKYFFHREAGSGMYEKQTYSKYGRTLDKTFKAINRRSEIYEEIHSKGFTKYYKGRPTRKFKMFLRELKALDSEEKKTHSLLLNI